MDRRRAAANDGRMARMSTVRACLLAALIAGCAAIAGRAPAEPAADAAAEKAVLKVRVTGLRNQRGTLRLGIFDSSKGFPRERGGALQWQNLPASTDGPTFAVELPPGRYAVVVLHDENSNKKLDANWLGIPKEGHGVTNNPKPLRRAATFKEAAFDLPAEGAEVKVSIQYKYL